MNTRQKICLGLGVAFFVASCLLPPWRHTLFGIDVDDIFARAGHAPLLDRPWLSAIDVPQLLIQSAVIGAITWFLVVLCGDGKRGATRSRGGRPRDSDDMHADRVMPPNGSEFDQEEYPGEARQRRRQANSPRNYVSPNGFVFSRSEANAGNDGDSMWDWQE